MFSVMVQQLDGSVVCVGRWDRYNDAVVDAGNFRSVWTRVWVARPHGA